MYRLEPREFEKVNTQLVAESLPTMDELAGTVQKTIAKVLRAKRIRSDADYYIVKEIVEDQSSDMDPEDLTTLTALVDAYGTMSPR